MNDYPSYVRGSVRFLIIREMSISDLLDDYATASLKRVTSDTNHQEDSWAEYWYDLRDELDTRLRDT